MRDSRGREVRENIRENISLSANYSHCHISPPPLSWMTHSHIKNFSGLLPLQNHRFLFPNQSNSSVQAFFPTADLRDFPPFFHSLCSSRQQHAPPLRIPYPPSLKRQLVALLWRLQMLAVVPLLPLNFRPLARFSRRALLHAHGSTLAKNFRLEIKPWCPLRLK